MTNLSCAAELIYKEVVDYERQSLHSSTSAGSAINNHITGKSINNHITGKYINNHITGKSIYLCSPFCGDGSWVEFTH